MCISSLFSQVVINEYCLRNGNGIVDSDGDHSDWIELHNASNQDIFLSGYSLSDQADEPGKWMLPSVNLQVNEYRIVFLSGKNRTGDEWHTNFKFAVDEETVLLFTPDNLPASPLSIVKPQLDHSTGLMDGGGNNLFVFTHPSPGEPNDYYQAWPGYAQAPTLSVAPGFHKNPINLQILGNGIIHFTTDGSVPDEYSPIYIDPFYLGETQVVKARSFEVGKLPSEIVTSTYLIGFETELPVFSISTNPSLLFDDQTGIMVDGPNWTPEHPHLGANYWLDVEVPAHLEFFTPYKFRAINQDIGIKVHGGSISRTRPQKSLRMMGRKAYGKGRMDYPFFTDKPQIKEYKRIVLRNASGDFNQAHFRDGMAQKVILKALNVDVLAYEPAVLFINGRYYGIENIREKTGKYYYENNHMADPDQIDAMKEDTIVEYGDSLDFHNLNQFIVQSDLSSDAVFDSVNKRFDTESFADYLIAETFSNNNDWPLNNIKYWRERKPGSRWRYMLFDLDVTYNGEGWSPVTLNWLSTCLDSLVPLTRHMQIAVKLFENNRYKNAFINRYADLLNTAFTPDSISIIIDGVKSKIASEMIRHKQRWGGNINDWNYEIDEVLMPFVEQRQTIVFDQVKSEFQLSEPVELTWNVWPIKSGRIKINSIEPRNYPFTGKYFSEIPITITAQASTGAVFHSWKSNDPALNGSTAETLQIVPREGLTLEALFSPISFEAGFQLFPNPASSEVNIGFMLDKPGDCAIRVEDLSGRFIREINFSENQPGFIGKTISTEGIPQGIYLIQLLTPTKQQIQKLVLSGF